jgi:ribose 5-phosphate isomerase B
MKIAIGADHRGFAQKEYIRATLSEHTWLDIGSHSDVRSDYPLFAAKVCEALLSGKAERGILLCGTGVGMSIAANRFAHIYAALAWSVDVAIRSRQEDASNIVVLPSDYISQEEAVIIIQEWLQAVPSDGRYQERIAMIDAITK